MPGLTIYSRFGRTAIALALLASSKIALAAPPAGFDQRVEQLRKSVGVPEVSTAIVESRLTCGARTLMRPTWL